MWINDIKKNIKYYQIKIDNILLFVWTSPTILIIRKIPIISNILHSYFAKFIFSFALIRFIFGVLLISLFYYSVITIICFKLYISYKVFLYKLRLFCNLLKI